MRKLLILSALLPLQVLAQQAAPADEYANTSSFKFGNAMRCHGSAVDWQKEEPGELKIINENAVFVTGPLKTEPKIKTVNTGCDCWMIIGSKVQLSLTPDHSVSLKADKLKYYEDEKRGVLEGNVIIEDNGEEKRIGEKAIVRVTGDQFKIVSFEESNRSKASQKRTSASGKQYPHG